MCVLHLVGILVYTDGFQTSVTEGQQSLYPLFNKCTKNVLLQFCNRTFLVHQVQSLLASVTGRSKPPIISFTVNFHPRNRDGQERLDTEIFKWETRLAADKGLQPSTSRPSTQDQNKIRKGISPMWGGSLSPRHGASSGGGWRNGLRYGGQLRIN